MGKLCSLRKCPTRKDKSKVSLFKAPEKSEERKKWEELLGCSLTALSVICEKHFDPSVIKTENQFTDPLGFVHKETLKKKQLKPGALPRDEVGPDERRRIELMKLTTFTFPSSRKETSNQISGRTIAGSCSNENSSYLLNVDEVHSKDIAVEAHDGVIEKSPLCISGSEIQFLQDVSVDRESPVESLSSSIANSDATETKTSEITATESSQNNLYHILLHQKDKFTFPSGWTLTHSSTNNILMFSLLDANPSPTSTSKNVVPVFQKQIIVHSNAHIQIRFFDKNLDQNKLNIDHQVQTIEQFQDLLTKVDESEVCVGGPFVRQYAKAYPECAFKDRGVWRHDKCPLILAYKGICKYCFSLNKTLSQNIQRQGREKLKMRMKRRALSPPVQQKIAHALKKRKLTLAKLSRKEKKLAEATEELAAVHESLQTVKGKKLDEDLSKHKNLPENQVTLIKECFAAGTLANPKGRRYSDEWILLCLLTYIRSSATYNMLRRSNILPLPAKSSILRYLKSSNVDCGFDENFFALFSEELKCYPERARNGILSFDEISVRTSINVNTKTMTFDGLTNYGKNSELNADCMDELADHGLVFMFSSLAADFHQPVAMFASKGTTKSNILAALVVLAIVNIEKAGGKVQGIVCDGATTNRSMWTELGVSGSLKGCHHYFENPFDDKRLVYAFSDAPHLIKCIRNRLEERKILKVNGGDVQWKYYESLYKRDSISILRVCPKLTQNHVNVPKSMKMRVSLATQLFSNSVAHGLEMYYKHDEMQDNVNNEFAGYEATKQFTIQVNNLFDVLNRSYTKEGIRKGSADFEVLDKAIKWLDEWEGTTQKDYFLTKSTAEGLRVTLHSTRDLSQHLLNNCTFQYVLTSKMNQDCLEQFFGCIRQAGCQNDHPTMHTFKQLYHLLSIYKIIKPPKSGNCTVREDGSAEKKKITLAHLKVIFPDAQTSYKHNRLMEMKKELEDKIDTEEWDWEHLIENECDTTKIENYIIYYLSGYVARKLRKWVKCHVCKSAFISSYENIVNECTEAQLVTLKSNGGLIHPNIHLFTLFQKLEMLFQRHLGNARVYTLVLEDLFSDEYHFTFPCAEHKADMISRCIDYYLTMRMHQYSKLKNRDNFKKSQDIKKKSKILQRIMKLHVTHFIFI